MKEHLWNVLILGTVAAGLLRASNTMASNALFLMDFLLLLYIVHLYKYSEKYKWTNDFRPRGRKFMPSSTEPDFLPYFVPESGSDAERTDPPVEQKSKLYIVR